MTGTKEQPTAMDIAELEALLDAYGASLDAWPVEQGERARALLASSEDALALQQQAAELDTLLDQAPTVEPSAALREQVLAAAPQPAESWLARLDRWTERLWPFTPRWQPSAALVAAAVFGVVLGASLPDASTVDEPSEVAEVAFGSYADWDETP